MFSTSFVILSACGGGPDGRSVHSDGGQKAESAAHPQDNPDSLEAVADAQQAVGPYIQAVQIHQVEDAAAVLVDQAVTYVSDVAYQEEMAREEAERQAAAAAAAVHQQPAVRPSTPEDSASNGRPAGGHSDAWWRGVANCEQGGRNDPYFGYFSYMDGSAGGLSWDQQVAKGNATIAQYGESAWAQACVNAGYAASPGG